MNTAANANSAAREACELLAIAYADGELNGGEVKWEALNDAHQLALAALGKTAEQFTAEIREQRAGENEGKTPSPADCSLAGLYVVLASRGNPDMQQDPFAPLYGCEPDTTAGGPRATIDDLKQACREFIARNDLGGSQWAGGGVYRDGVPIGRIRYNATFEEYTEREREAP